MSDTKDKRKVVNVCLDHKPSTLTTIGYQPTCAIGIEQAFRELRHYMGPGQLQPGTHYYMSKTKTTPRDLR